MTPQEIQEMHNILMNAKSSLSKKVIDDMKSTCLASLKQPAYSYIYKAQETNIDGEKMVGVWTDGLSLIADNKRDCAFPLVVGEVYKVSIYKAKKEDLKNV